MWCKYFAPLYFRYLLYHDNFSYPLRAYTVTHQLIRSYNLNGTETNIAPYVIPQTYMNLYNFHSCLSNVSVYILTCTTWTVYAWPILARVHLRCNLIVATLITLASTYSDDLASVVGRAGIEPTVFLVCLIYSQVSSPAGHIYPYYKSKW